jgi:Fic family protein
MTTLDGRGNLHDRAGLFAGRLLAESDTSVIGLMRTDATIFSLALAGEGAVVSEGFPAVTYTERLWTAIEPGMSRGRARRNRGTYLSPLLPDIADLQVELDPDLDATVADATDAMLEFDRGAGPASAPFAAILLRSESSSSSQIERLTASARRISLATLGDQSSPNATQVARNVEAMRAAVELADRLDVDAILSMHEHLMRDIEDDAGRLRDQLVWVGGDSPVTARHVGPDHEQVPRHLDDLVAFMRRDDLPPLVQAAIAHAQFETIHPFTDGNGRTGRALIPALLRHRGVTRNLSVPISAGLLGDTESYFDALTAYRSGNPGPIVERFTAAVGESLTNARQLRGDVDRVREQVLGIAERRTANLERIADFLVAEPAFSADMVVRATGMPTATAYRLIGRLQAASLIREEHKIRGEQVWTVPGTLAALEGFARRAGKRSWQPT